MFVLEGTVIGDTLKKRFASISDGAVRNKAQSLFVGAVEVRHMLQLQRPGTEGSTEVQALKFIANLGVEGDMYGRGLVPMNSVREPVLSHIYGMSGDMSANLAQVTLVDLNESMRLAQRLRVGYMPLGFQRENIVLGEVANRSFSLRGLSELWPGSTITFIARDGILRTASLHIVGQALPYEFAQGLLLNHFGVDSLARPYQRAAAGISGVTAIVKTAGLVHQGDVALVWRPA